MLKRYRNSILAIVAGALIAACATYAPYSMCDEAGCGDNVTFVFENEAGE